MSDGDCPYPVRVLYHSYMSLNAHGVSSRKNPKRTRKTKKRLAAKYARKAAATA